jgi:hypothetical protein
MSTVRVSIDLPLTRRAPWATRRVLRRVLGAGVRPPPSWTLVRRSPRSPPPPSRTPPLSAPWSASWPGRGGGSVCRWPICRRPTAPRCAGSWATATTGTRGGPACAPRGRRRRCAVEHNDVALESSTTNPSRPALSRSRLRHPPHRSVKHRRSTAPISGTSFFAVSEAVTNAATHGRLRPGSACGAPDRNVATVTDCDDGPADPFAGLLPVSDTCSAGLGLWLTHQLCSQSPSTPPTTGSPSASWWEHASREGS